MGEVGESGGQVEGADVVHALLVAGLAGVEPHADRDAQRAGPCGGRQGALRGDGRQHGSVDPVEHGRDAVTRCRQELPAPANDLVADDRLVDGQARLRLERMGVPGQRLRVDAGEEARHRSGGELRNGPRSRGAVGPASRDAALQVAELSRGLGAGLLGQQRPVGLVGAERLGLATLAGQRAHQEPSRAVPVRVVPDEQDHLGGDLREATARQARFASRFLGGDALLNEPGGGSLRPGFVGELLQGGT